MGHTYEVGQGATNAPVYRCPRCCVWFANSLRGVGWSRVAAAIELTVRDLGSEWKLAAGALSVACRSLSRQLATELRMREAETVTPPAVRSARGTRTTDPPDSCSNPGRVPLHPREIMFWLACTERRSGA
jgi:hypothetical protein